MPEESSTHSYSFFLFQEQWKKALRSSVFRRQGFITLCCGLLLASTASAFLHFIQYREGSIFPDPLLIHLSAIDVSWYIFACLYSALILGIVQLLFHPYLLLATLQAYLLLTLLRAFAIYSFPLEPPSGLIPLTDPLIDRLFYEKIIITKDLFFSGHVATLSLLFFSLPSGSVKKIVGILTLAVALLLLLQHAHYTIDVFAAPLAAFLSKGLICHWHNGYKKC